MTNLLKLLDPPLIMAVCTLHNFCINEDKRLRDDVGVDFQIEMEEEVNNFICYGSTTSDAERKRSEIARNL